MGRRRGEKLEIRGVEVEWFGHLTGNAKVVDLSLELALMFIRKTLIFICHSIPRREMGT